ncbi:MAG: hypothetical protein PF637_10860 [Spirochaetes bacterium]|nr:hypothetical protein [Spirochaetota bacterium]
MRLQGESQVVIGKRAFLQAALIIFILMMLTGVLTIILPSGQYERVVDNLGRTIIVPDSFRYVQKPDYPFWRWLTSPLEVLFPLRNAALITIIIFILFVGGAISLLEKSEVMADLIGRLVKRFKDRKYLLMAILIFLFMFMSSFLGIYEGLVPLIIFIVPLAHSLGWDSLTGLGISLLPLSFGFAAAVTNPFTVAVAQSIADLPLFSGAWLRIIFFFIVYLVLYRFVSRYARRIEQNPQLSPTFKQDKKLISTVQNIPDWEEKHPGMRHALIFFSCCMVCAMVSIVAVSVLSSFSVIPNISVIAFPLMGLLFFVGGVGAALFARMNLLNITKTFFSGWLAMLPGVILILMAYSIKHIIDQGMITDTILNRAAGIIASAPAVGAAFLVYGVTLVMNFFIGSASAKAFLMMPILTPLADLVGITRQTAVLAFDFGDGFSNMVFPSNALLLIALSFTVVSYPQWIKYTFKLQLFMLLISSLFLAFAVYIDFGPF